MDPDLSGGQAPWPWAVPPPCHQTLLPSPSLEGGTREAGPGQLGCRPDCNWKLCSFLAPPGGLGSPGKRKQVCEPSPQWLRWAKPQAALPMCTSTQVPCQICVNSTVLKRKWRWQHGTGHTARKWQNPKIRTWFGHFQTWNLSLQPYRCLVNTGTFP